MHSNLLFKAEWTSFLSFKLGGFFSVFLFMRKLIPVRGRQMGGGYWIKLDTGFASSFFAIFLLFCDFIFAFSST